MSHWQGKMTRRYTDTLWTKYIKLRDKGRCVFRFQCSGFEGSDVHHFKGRRKESVRFDDENTDLCCRSCHSYVHRAEGQKHLEEWKEKQLGERGYKLLILRAETTGKRDDFITKLYIQQKLKEIQANAPT